MTGNTISQALELTKIAVAGANGPWISQPETVAKFLEAVAKKIQELKGERE